MLKIILALLAALMLLGFLACGIVFGAKAITVRVNQVEQQDCLSGAQAQHNQHPDCPKTETLWDRGLEDPVAYYTLWLAFFTIALAVGGLVQSVLIGRQISLARDEFISSHRPKIIVHSVELAYGVNEEGFPTLGVEIHCFNVGNTDAIIDEFVGDIQIREVPLRANIILPTIEISPVTIKAGEGQHLRVNSNFDDRALNIATRATGSNSLLCIAAFVYRDGRGTPRQTGLCCQYSAASGEGRWHEYEAPEAKVYKYAY